MDSSIIIQFPRFVVAASYAVTKNFSKTASLEKTAAFLINASFLGTLGCIITNCIKKNSWNSYWNMAALGLFIWNRLVVQANCSLDLKYFPSLKMGPLGGLFALAKPVNSEKADDVVKKKYNEAIERLKQIAGSMKELIDLLMERDVPAFTDLYLMPLRTQIAFFESNEASEQLSAVQKYVKTQKEAASDLWDQIFGHLKSQMKIFYLSMQGFLQQLKSGKEKTRLTTLYLFPAWGALRFSLTTKGLLGADLKTLSGYVKFHANKLEELRGRVQPEIRNNIVEID